MSIKESVEYFMVVVKPVKPITRQQCEVYVDTTDIVGDVKTMVEAILQIPENRQHLVHRGRVLEDSR